MELDCGIGGGGGGGPAGAAAELSGMGAGDMGGGGEPKPALSGPLLSSLPMLLIGRGGAMVPNKMLARCLAPLRFAPPDSDSDSLPSSSEDESTTDQSSSEAARARVRRSLFGPVDWEVSGWAWA